MRSQWVGRPARQPRVVSGVKVEAFAFDAEQAQLSQARLDNVGEVARMFGIPGKLLEYGVPGSSLTYQNLAAVGDDLVRFCLAPGYLEPVEQAMSDLLTRSTVARYDVAGLFRADYEARARVYRTALGEGVPWIIPAEVRALEGLDPGGPEFAPVPLALPSAEPALPAGLEREA